MHRIVALVLMLVLATLPCRAAWGQVAAAQLEASGPPPAAVPIAEVLADLDGDTVPDAKGRLVRVRGTVVIPPDVLRIGNFSVAIQDDSGGLTLFHRDTQIPLEPGDVVEATGRVEQFRGAGQLDGARVRLIGKGPVPDAMPMPVRDVASRRHMGRRVQVEGVTGDLALDSFGLLQLAGDDGASIALFIPAPVTGQFDWQDYPRGTRVSVDGVVSMYKPTWPFDSGYQLVVTSPTALRVLQPPPPAWVAWALWGAVGFVLLLTAALAVFLVVHNRAKARQRELATLTALSAALAAPDLDEEQLARHACQILTAYGIVEAAMVQAFDAQGQLQPLAVATADPELGAALQFDQPLPSGATSLEAHRQKITTRVSGYGLTLLTIHPLLAAADSQGFLVALSARPGRPSQMQERTLLAAVKLLAMALENSRMQQRARIERQELQQLVITDDLTKLYNRRFLDEYLRVQIPLAQRRGGGLAFLVIDIDHFKDINDSWGHLAGDRVLAGVAAQIRDASRSSDLPVRLGGEEFLAVVADTDLENVLVFAERLRVAIASTSFGDAAAGTSLQVTVSIGVAVFGLHGTTAAALLQASDQAMYASKRNGRNMVTVAEAPAAP